MSQLRFSCKILIIFLRNKNIKCNLKRDTEKNGSQGRWLGRWRRVDYLQFHRSFSVTFSSPEARTRSGNGNIIKKNTQRDAILFTFYERVVRAPIINEWFIKTMSGSCGLSRLFGWLWIYYWTLIRIFFMGKRNENTIFRLAFQTILNLCIAIM